MANGIEDAFAPETQYYPPKEKIDLFIKSVSRLEELLNEFKNRRLDNMYDIEIFFSNIKQIYFDYQNQLSELNYDMMKNFKNLPAFEIFFRQLIEKEGKSTEKEKMQSEFMLYRKSKFELIRDMDNMIPTLAKLLSFYSLLLDMFFTALEKQHSYITKPREIKPREIKLSKSEEEVMTYLNEGKSIQEIAQIRNTTPNAIRYLKHSATRKEKQLSVSTNI